MHERGHLPSGAKLARLVEFIEREVGIARVPGRMRNGKVRLWQAWVIAGELLHQRQRSGLVLLAGKQGIEEHEAVGAAFLIGEQVFEVRLGFIESASVDQHLCQGLVCFSRAWVKL